MPNKPKPNERILRYVPNGDIEAYKAAGWITLESLVDCHHGQWAALMEWPGPDKPGPLSPPYDQRSPE